MGQSKFLIVIGGPTASGKTALAIHCALQFQTEILSADSRQFYREMNIGTAKPTPEELAAVPHHFIDSLSIHDSYSVGDFERAARNLLRKLFFTKNAVVMAGGSGLFVKAVCDGLDVFPEVPLSIQDQVNDLFKKQGLAALQAELQSLDPLYFKQVDIHNPARLIRAIGVAKASGKPFSSFRGQPRVTDQFTPIFIQLDWPRQVLYERINQRVDEMMHRGLETEARKLYPFRHLQALQTVGYQELFDYFDGLQSLEEAIDKIKQHSRNFAKRQLTWMRKYGQWHVCSPLDLDGICQFVEESMQNTHS